MLGNFFCSSSDKLPGMLAPGSIASVCNMLSHLPIQYNFMLDNFFGPSSDIICGMLATV